MANVILRTECIIKSDNGILITHYFLIIHHSSESETRSSSFEIRDFPALLRLLSLQQYTYVNDSFSDQLLDDRSIDSTWSFLINLE